MQGVRRVRLSIAVLSRDEFGEGSDRHLGCGRSAGRCPARLQRTQSTRILRVRGDPKTGEGGHFVQYIEKFFKLNAEATGSPVWVQGPDDEDRYSQQFRESEGIEHDKNLIQKNAVKGG